MKFEKFKRTEFLRKVCPFPVSRTGRCFYRDKGRRKELEIDAVCLNEDTKDILFAECKWKDKVDAKKIFRELKEKAQYVQWRNDKRKEQFAIFAKSFKEKTKQPDLFLFDLADLGEGLLRYAPSPFRK